MKEFEFEFDRSFFLRLDYGKDLVRQLEEFLTDREIHAAKVSAIGAVRNAVIGYYDQEKREYVKRELNEPMEIISLLGNVSLKDGKPFCHIHVLLGKNGEVYGGHLFSAEVFACEVFIQSLKGEAPERTFDEQTGLMLW
ncbi:MAG: DNA-binding protein [Archaeoglobus sp.]|uniref:PPC domain-containing DNA-binding protein n=1 Tax=Archaeoglobus sp. TaxID=1872626 RepID=UPI001DADB0D9|nr:PPC domain-containing DNA-binding protein [Archaeoglobus sp.]MBO8179917.1 DNA-binding protein [Archaeoglobus sp.]